MDGLSCPAGPVWDGSIHADDDLGQYVFHLGGSVRRCFFLGIVLAFVFIMYPIKKNMKLKPNPYSYLRHYPACGGSWRLFLSDHLQRRADRHGPPHRHPQIIIGIIAILVLVEACRRVVGIPIIIVAAAFVAYTLLPMGADKPLQGTIYNLVYTTNGIIGTPIQVCSTYIFLFVLFGSFLEATGIAAFFIDCANSIAGAATGGPAKVAVISSALCGMVSGSSVGNTVTTGAVTIPLMKRTGYPRVCRRRRGRPLPPAVRSCPHHRALRLFLMAEMTDTEYADILVRAILPAALYFTGIFLMVHFKAKSIGLKGLDKDSLPKGKDIFPSFIFCCP